jgi:ACT domain-containing protein
MADHQINILDISQTIIQGFFNMMMIVDTSKMTIDYVTMTEEITRLGEDTGVQIKCQREDIFDKMHRI